MSEEHTQGRVTFREDGDACHWSMLTEDGQWWLALLANGEQTTPRQIANFRRLAACWNACEGISTENLEDNIPVVELATRFNEALKRIKELNSILERREAVIKILEADLEAVGAGGVQSLYAPQVAQNPAA